MIDGKCEAQTVNLISPSVTSVTSNQNGHTSVSVQSGGQLLTTTTISQPIVQSNIQLNTLPIIQSNSQPIIQTISQPIIQPIAQANPNLTPNDCAAVLNAYWSGYKCVCKVGFRSSNGVCLPLN